VSTIIYMARAGNAIRITVLKFCTVIDVREICSYFFNKLIKYILLFLQFRLHRECLLRQMWQPRVINWSSWPFEMSFTFRIDGMFHFLPPSSGLDHIGSQAKGRTQLQFLAINDDFRWSLPTPATTRESPVWIPLVAWILTYLLTYGAEPFLRSCQFFSHSENSQQF
jgi:hypothetical protein